MSLAISAHGTLIERAPQATPTAFVVIAELRDIKAPPLTRKAIETTPHNDPEEGFVVGIRRKGEMTFQIGWIPSDATHNATAGLIKSWIDGSRDIFRITYPDNSKWVFSGYVINVGPSMPVDDGLVADITIRPTYTMSFF